MSLQPAMELAGRYNYRVETLDKAFRMFDLQPVVRRGVTLIDDGEFAAWRASRRPDDRLVERNPFTPEMVEAALTDPDCLDFIKRCRERRNYRWWKRAK